MKLASYSYQNKPSFGLVTDHGIIDIPNRLGDSYLDLRSYLASSNYAEADKWLAQGTVDYSLEEITFLPVIPNPDKIFCIGLNYDEHRIEANRDKSANPTVFFRVANSQIGHLSPMLLPKESKNLDFEGEIAVIIGRKGRRIAEEDAYNYVAGYACYNDGSIRDWQNHTHQWGPGKNFEGTGAFGPWMVTRDEIGDGEILTLETRLNGEVMQHATTDMLLFPIPTLISYVSSFTTLEPGDVIVTGTPGGIGMKRNPPVYMKAGDVVEIEVSRVGVLRNTIVAE